MTLSDAEVAEVVREAVDLVDPELPVHIAPAPNDDPYRWGSSGWSVTIGAGRRVQVWVPADASSEWLRDEIAARLRPEAPR